MKERNFLFFECFFLKFLKLNEYFVISVMSPFTKKCIFFMILLFKVIQPRARNCLDSRTLLKKLSFHNIISCRK